MTIIADPDLRGIYLTVDEMNELEARVRSLSLSRRSSSQSFLQGSYSSRLQGRGIRFEEVRQYVQGDDVRHIDWNTTARLQKPYVRTYSEDREKPLILVIDQRQDMFFGSSLMMKSCAAASAAAHLSWMAQSDKDRIGALVLDDAGVETVTVGQGRRHLSRLFSVIADNNCRLKADDPGQDSVGQDSVDSAEMLNRALEATEQISGRAARIVLISDLAGFNEVTRQKLAELNCRHSVSCIHIYDALADRMPESGDFTATRGGLIGRFSMGQGRLKETLQKHFRVRVKTLHQTLNQEGIPVVRIHTGASITEQLQVLIHGQEGEGL